MFHHMVVPLDGSEFSRIALPYAAALAPDAGQTVELVSAVDSRAALGGVGYADNLTNSVPALGAYAHLPGGGAEFLESIRGARRAELEAATEELRTNTSAAVRWELLDGEPSEAVVAHIEASGADLIVMSTHGRGGMARAWLGSVADRLVRHVTVPVLLVRPGERPASAAAAGPASGRTIRRLLVPLDGSELAEAALEPAASVVARTGGALVLARVTGTDLPIGSPYPPEEGVVPEEHADAQVQEARRYLDGVAARLRDGGVDVANVVVRDGATSATILDIARESADAIAMATHGRGGLRRWILGSVSDKVLRGGDLPVLLVRPGENDAPPAKGRSEPGG